MTSINNKFDIKTLEFDKYKELLNDSFVSLFSRLAVSNIDILTDIDLIYKRQNEIRQAVEFSDSNNFIEKDEEFFNLFYSINKETKTFDPMDFVIIKNFLIKIKNIKEKIESKKYKYLIPYTLIFSEFDYLTELIVSSINDKGEVRDDATPRLQEIRYGLNEHKNRIKKILSGIFNSNNSDKFIQDKVIVIRNGRYTIPCKTNFSQYIQGIIQDKSASGQTLYIEPASCVNENNSMQELIIAESEEIAKIIYSLITSLKASYIDLEKAVKEYSYLLMILELGIFYSNKVWTFGELSSMSVMESIHHPLLYLKKGRESVPVDFEISSYGSQIFITGPNTGGKTAALKSAGLNHIIAYCGLPVFGKNFKFMFFDGIYADIGDNQSLVMDLSTFSSHMLNIKNIIENAGSKSLVLLDELGTGTEPSEGASLAVAVLRYMKEKGITSVTTTHFTEVKNYALNTDNTYFYAVDFDYDTFAPRYRLLKDIMGKSDPVMIAERLGFKESIIKYANEELMKYKTSLEVRVEELNKMIAENEHIKKQLIQKEAELKEKEQRFQAANSELEKKLNSKELDLLEETYSLLQKSKRLATEKAKINPEKISDIMKETEKKINAVKEKQEIIQDLKVNDIIYLDKYKKTAKVLEISGENVTLNVEGMKIQFKKKDITGNKIDNKKTNEKRVNVTNNTSKSNVKRELLLVGKRVEEALDLLEKFIDDSILAGYDKIYIVHGRGSGQLRKAVHEYLRKHHRVESYSLADNTEGGNAVTIAKI